MDARKTYNGSTLDQDLTLEADVVIVVLLEKGGYHTARTFSQN
jgi:hypothetical protein